MYMNVAFFRCFLLSSYLWLTVRAGSRARVKFGLPTFKSWLSPWEEDRNLRLKLKEICIQGEVLDGVKIRKGGIVGRVDGHKIYDPSARLVGGLPKEHK